MTGLLAYAGDGGRPLPRGSGGFGAGLPDTYAEVVSFWWPAVMPPRRFWKKARSVTVGASGYEYRKPFLLIWLPSGRAIYYYKPRMEMREIHTGKQRWDQQQMRMVDEIYKRTS